MKEKGQKNVGGYTMHARKGVRRLRLQREAEGYLELGMSQHALRSLERIGDPSSFDSSTLYLWGEALRSEDRYEEAIIPLQRAAESAPENINIRLALGWCFKRVGRIHLAIEALEQALAAEPNEPLLRYNLACYCSLAGNKSRAIRFLSQTLTVAPGYRSLIDNETDFDPLRHDPEFQALCEKVKG
jgi:Flp pilus assembly protein TadD